MTPHADTDYPAIVVLVLVFAACAYLMWSRFEFHRRLSLTGVVFVTLLVMHGVSAVPFALGAVDYEFLPGISLQPTRELPWVLSLSVGLFVVAATMMARALKFNIRHAQASFFNAQLSIGQVNPVFLAIAVVGTSAVAILYAYGTGVTGLQILLEHSGDEVFLDSFRQRFLEENPYYYIGSYAATVFGPVVLLILLNLVRATQKLTERLLIGLAGAVLFTVLVVANIASLNKVPLGMLLLYVLLNQRLAHSRSPRIGIREWLLVAVALAGAGFVGYYLTYDLDLAAALQLVIERVFLVPQAVLNAYLYVYPGVLDFSNGLGIGLVARLLGGDYVNPQDLVGAILIGRGGFNCYWACELWANFGYPGVALGSVLAGIAIVSLDWWCLRRGPRTVLSLALYSFMIVSVIRVGSVSLFTMLLSGGLVVAPLFVEALGLRDRGQSLRNASTTAVATPDDRALQPD